MSDHPRPPILAVALTKGGTGKTTTAINLAAELAHLGRRVLLVDADPQAQAAAALGAVSPDARESGGLGRVLSVSEVERERSARAAIVRGVRYGMDVCPAGPDLAGEASRLGADPSAGLISVADSLSALLSAGTDLGGHAYDVVIVDTPPGWGPLVLGVLAAASGVLSPVALHPLGLDAVGAFGGHLRGVQRTREHFGGDALPYLEWIVPTMLDRRASASSEVLAALEARAAEMDRGDGAAPAVAAPIPYSVVVQAAAAFGRTAREHPGATHAVTTAYADLGSAVSATL